MQEIEKLRAEIDEIHVELTKLLKRRLGLTYQIWKIKQAQQISFLDSRREELILEKLNHASNDFDEKNFLQLVFKNILSESKKYLEAKIK